MKKVGILTHYDVNNLGAQLQLFGLAKEVEKLGYDPVILTYKKNYDFNHNEELKNQITIKSIPYIIKNYLFKRGLRLTWFNYKKLKINKQFREEKFKQAFYTQEKMDKVIVGSDEVFSIPAGINIMMFGHCVPCTTLIAYAPSFGQTDLSLIESRKCEYLISSGLKSFAFLSARDLHTKDMIFKLAEKEAPIVCDPVILHDFSNDIMKKRKIRKKYILVYSMDRWMINKEEIQAIKEFAKKNDLLTVSAGTYHGWCNYNVNCNCLEWMDYFKYSECVITDTFHGAVLAISTNRPLAVYIRGLNVNKLTDLLRETELSDRIFTEFKCNEIEKVFQQQIDYVGVKSRLDKMRTDSNVYLKNALMSYAEKRVQ